MKCSNCKVEMNRVCDLTANVQLCQCISCKTIVAVSPPKGKSIGPLPDKQ